MSKTEHTIDVQRLRRAIYTVSARHDWAHTVDTEDRTEEIAAEYDHPSDITEDGAEATP